MVTNTQSNGLLIFPQLDKGIHPKYPNSPPPKTGMLKFPIVGRTGVKCICADYAYFKKSKKPNWVGIAQQKFGGETSKKKITLKKYHFPPFDPFPKTLGWTHQIRSPVRLWITFLTLFGLPACHRGAGCDNPSADFGRAVLGLASRQHCLCIIGRRPADHRLRGGRWFLWRCWGQGSWECTKTGQNIASLSTDKIQIYTGKIQI